MGAAANRKRQAGDGDDDIAAPDHVGHAFVEPGNAPLLVHAGGAQMGVSAAASTRTPAGHPEGYLEAFANIYRDFAAGLRGQPAPLLPGIADGLRGMQFIAAAVAASRDNCGWVPLSI